MTVAEFLASLYGDKQTMALDELTKAAEAYQDAKFVDLKTGDYVDKGKIAELQGQLDTANRTIKGLKEAAKKWDGKDPDQLSRDLETLQKRYDDDIAAMRLQSAIDLALSKSKSRDPQITRAALRMEDIKLDGDKLLGLDDQLEALKKEKAWLFEDASTPPPLAPGPGTDPVMPPTPAPTSLVGALRAKYEAKG